MSIYYSASTGGFYDDEFQDIPADALVVDNLQYEALLGAQEGGATIEPDPVTGEPVSVQQVGPDTAAMRAALVAATRAEARRRVEAILPYYTQIGLLRSVEAGTALTQTETDAFAAIDAVTAAATTIEQDIAAADEPGLEAFDVATNPDWPGAN